VDNFSAGTRGSASTEYFLGAAATMSYFYTVNDNNCVTCNNIYVRPATRKQPSTRIGRPESEKSYFPLLFRIPDAEKIRYPNLTELYGYRTSLTGTGRYFVRNPKYCQPNFSSAFKQNFITCHKNLARYYLQCFSSSLTFALSLIYAELNGYFWKI